MKKFITDNWIILVFAIAFITSTVLAIRNNAIIRNNLAIQDQTENIKQLTRDILNRTMHGLDLGIRGFGLTRDDKLLTPYNEAIVMTPRIFQRLDSLLGAQGYSDQDKLQAVRQEVDEYVKFSNRMLSLARNDDMALFTEMLRQDKGFDVWQKYTELPARFLPMRIS